jgi:hypothetical protein
MSDLDRRRFLKAGAAAATLTGMGTGLGACSTAKFGSQSSYLTPILEPQKQNAVYHWVDIALQQTRDMRVPPPRAAYNYAAPMCAGFLAANGILKRYEDPIGVGDAPEGADPEVAYGVAFATAAAQCFGTPFVLERRAFKNRFAGSEAKSLGVEWGRKVGLAINRMRTRDGAEPSQINYYHGRYPRRTDILNWNPTGARYGDAVGPAVGHYERGLFPGLGKVKPWTMTHSSQFQPAEFLDPASPEFGEQYDYVRRMGGVGSKERTADQSEIAIFWEDGPWGITPPGHFLFIAIQVLQEKGMDFLDTARAFALLGMTQADAAINAWNCKYQYDVVRPETAIRFRGEKFANQHEGVRSEKSWTSYIPTPNFPAYTSGHSTFGAVGAEMTAFLLGTDQVTFSHESPDFNGFPQLVGKRRTWTSLSQAAEENGMSRLYGGVHWELDHTAGMTAGRAIARQAFERWFKARA